MSAIEMACIRLTDALKNQSAVIRYTTMMDSKYVHPGWVDYQKRSSNHGKDKTHRR